MIDLKTAVRIHGILIDRFGGSSGIRDLGALESALARSNATFDLRDLYPTIIDKAAAVFESIIINHPFVDGNKRCAFVLMRLILLSDNPDLVASQNEKYDFVISASKGELRFDEIKAWLNTHVSAKK